MGRENKVQPYTRKPNNAETLNLKIASSSVFFAISKDVAPGLLHVYAMLQSLSPSPRTGVMMILFISGRFAISARRLSARGGNISNNLLGGFKSTHTRLE